MTLLARKGVAKIACRCRSQNKIRNFVGPITDDFRKHVDDVLQDRKELQKHIVFTGNVTDREELYSLYSRSKIICMTSRYEGFCIATIEGMYFGCVPVLTNYGKATLDQTDNNRLGAVIKIGDIDALKDKLEYYMVNEDALDKAIPECKAYAREVFDYKSIAELLDGYLRNVM